MNWQFFFMPPKLVICTSHFSPLLVCCLYNNFMLWLESAVLNKFYAVTMCIFSKYRLGALLCIWWVKGSNLFNDRGFFLQDYQLTPFSPKVKCPSKRYRWRKDWEEAQSRRIFLPDGTPCAVVYQLWAWLFQKKYILKANFQ
jgi:hypothetical protein